MPHISKRNCANNFVENWVNFHLLFDNFNNSIYGTVPMNNDALKVYLISCVVFSVVTGIGVTLFQTSYAWSTHMTFHNLADNASQLSIADATGKSPSTCTAQVNSNCEAGAEYVWYTIDVFTPPQDEQKPICGYDPLVGKNVCTYPDMIRKLGVYGHCDVYVTGSDGKYDVNHHCTAADAAGLKPPQNQTKTMQNQTK